MRIIARFICSAAVAAVYFSNTCYGQAPAGPGPAPANLTQLRPGTPALNQRPGVAAPTNINPALGTNINPALTGPANRPVVTPPTPALTPPTPALSPGAPALTPPTPALAPAATALGQPAPAFPPPGSVIIPNPNGTFTVITAQGGVIGGL